METKKYYDIVNPTFLTAKFTLEKLADVGNEDAKKYVDFLGIANALTNLASGAKESVFTPEEARNMLIGIATGIEARYEAISRLIRESGMSNVFEIACGYAPRALNCIKNGIDYVGLDVPAVIEEMEPLGKSLFPDAKHPIYVEGDATNRHSITTAAAHLNGELFIT